MLGAIEATTERDRRELSSVALQGVYVVDQHIEIVAGVTQVTTEQFRRSRCGGSCLA